MRRSGVIALLAVAVGFVFASAAMGQIVYIHGHDLWVMNDDGSGQRPLATAGQVGGNVSGSGSDFGVGVQPGGTALHSTRQCRRRMANARRTVRACIR